MMWTKMRPFSFGIIASGCYSHFSRTAASRSLRPATTAIVVDDVREMMVHGGTRAEHTMVKANESDRANFIPKSAPHTIEKNVGIETAQSSFNVNAGQWRNVLTTKNNNSTGQQDAEKGTANPRLEEIPQQKFQGSADLKIGSPNSAVYRNSDENLKKCESGKPNSTDKTKLKAGTYAGGGPSKNMKNASKSISMVTCYDYWSAKIINESNIDAILVGDSSAMVMHGYQNTTSATVDLMCIHVSAVARGAMEKFIIADMPFLSFRGDLAGSMKSVLQLVQSGAHALKIEGARGNLHLISHIIESGVPVMGHIGLTPQMINQLGGFKVQGKGDEKVEELKESAVALERAGCFALVLECIPDKVGKAVTDQVQIPTIGIGAGRNVSGQILVLQDMLGMNSAFRPKFLKTYLDGYELMKKALNDYDEEIKTKTFPHEEHCY